MLTAYAISVYKVIDDDHVLSIKERMEKNRINMAEMTKHHQKLSEERRKFRIMNGGETVNLLSKRMKEAIDLQNGAGINKDRHASARYEALVSQQNAIESLNSRHTNLNMSWSIEEDLEAAQDLFEYLFC
ncbi:hypothetical protein Tco_1405248 [Tanacetum coccineum]